VNDQTSSVTANDWVQWTAGMVITAYVPWAPEVLELHVAPAGPTEVELSWERLASDPSFGVAVDDGIADALAGRKRPLVGLMPRLTLR